MVSFSIDFDLDKCTDCGLCIKECVSGVIRLVEGKPRAVEPSWCNRCSHCVAVCPAGAVSHGGLKGTDSRKAVRNAIDPECYKEVVMTRRSVRWYKDEEVPQEDIEDILQLASYSPTASNAQDVGYIVIKDKELIQWTSKTIFGLGEKLGEFLAKPWGKALAWYLENFAGQKNIGRYAERNDFYKQWVDQGRDMITHNAPVLIIIHGPKKSYFVRDDCAIAAANITNYAHAKGLGTCYIGFVVASMQRSKKLRDRLGLPAGRKAYVALVMGKPTHKFTNTTIRFKPKVTLK